MIKREDWKETTKHLETFEAYVCDWQTLDLEALKTSNPDAYETYSATAEMCELMKKLWPIQKEYAQASDAQRLLLMAQIDKLLEQGIELQTRMELGLLREAHPGGTA